MTLLNDLPVGAKVGLDSLVFIYYIEAHPNYGPLVLALFQTRIQPGLNVSVSSVVSLAEVLVKPFELGRADLVRQYRDLLTGLPHLQLVPITPAISESAADLRARYKLRLPDAFQIAAALDRGASYFVTNDTKLRKVTELTVLVLDDYLPPAPS